VPESSDVSVLVAPGTVLVADDNRMNRLLLGRSLEQQGHTVVFAEHGREALELLRQRTFDVLLLDVVMPELDGYHVLEELKGDTHLRDIPVIMTSALDELDSVVKCVEMGAEDYLTKPINPVLLNARVNASVEKKRLRDQQRELISKFATKEVADDLLTSGFSLGGKHVEATAMFCDIRSFTSITEAREPDETIELLNDYYTLMMDAIGGEGGIVNQMVGDGLMAIFGAPAPREDHRLRAVLAACQMVELIRLFNVEQAAPGQGGDPDRNRHRVGPGGRRLHRDAAPRDVHVRWRHRQRRSPTRGADEGARPADPDQREHAPRPRRKRHRRSARRDFVDGEAATGEGLRGDRRLSRRRDRVRACLCRGPR
jgi:adenylate cyclase